MLALFDMAVYRDFLSDATVCIIPMDNSSSRTFRLVCPVPEIPLVEQLLADQGFIFVPESFSPFARTLVHEPFPLGASLAARFGYIYIQDKSSMLPPVALQPEAGAAVLDMCASPGSKTGFLGQLVGSDGFVLGNEPSRNRLATLRANLSRLNLVQCGTMSYAGESIPLPSAGNLWNEGCEKVYPGWQWILLDPPCSGWGTVGKNPQVTSLWQGDRLQPLISLQRSLLQEATRLLAPGGRLVYSTCTTNVQENEEQVRFACEQLGLRLIPLQPLGDLPYDDPLYASCEGTLKIPVLPDAQGFFIALLEKEAIAPGEHQQIWLDPYRLPVKKIKSGGRKKNIEEPVFFSAETFAGPFADMRVLSTGRTGIFNDIAHFLPEKSLDLLPPNFVWKGFPFASVKGKSGFKLNPSFRLVIPSMSEAHDKGLPVLLVDSPDLVLSLLSGKAVGFDTSSGEAGLYYHGLPLARLTIKNKRAVLPFLR